MLSLIALGLPAFAINPNQDVHIGQEPVRMRARHLVPQMQLRGAQPWQEFVEGEGAGWMVQFDEPTRTPHIAWGPGIVLGSLSDQVELESAVWDFLSRHEALMGISTAQLRLGSAVFDPDRNSWAVRLDRVVDGRNEAHTGVGLGGDLGTGFELPELETSSPERMSEALAEMAQYGQPRVWRGGVDLRIQDGKLSMFRMDTYPEASRVDVEPTVNASDAMRVAILDGPEPDSAHTIDGAVLVVMPWEVPGDLEYRLCWLVRSSTNLGSGSPGIWASFVDAHTGELLNVHNQIRFTTGSVSGEHDTRTVNDDWSVSPMPFVSISSDQDSGRADQDGQFDLDGDSFSSSLDGTFFQAINKAGSSGSLSFSATDEALWTSADATQAEISSYAFLHDVWEWGEIYAPEVGITGTKMKTNVNIDSSCNAYYDGDLNFYQSGSGCNNTGRIADVNYHEWGHGFHAYAADTWWVDGSIGEGSADVVAFFQTGDNIISPYFFTDGSGIRDVAEDRVFPDDWVDEVHYDGLIFAGAVWDLWSFLESDLGVSTGYDTTVELFVSALKTNPETADTYDEFIAADDDNGDLGDGTPNQCSIMDAFSLHGLGPGGSPTLMELAHVGIENQDAALDHYAIEAELVNLAPLCVELDDADLSLYFSIDEGENYTSVDLELEGAQITGLIPGQASGSIVHYYLEADTSTGTEIMSPAGGAIAPFSFVVGELETIYCDDFEENDGDYFHMLVSGEETDGADDWQWGRPGGQGGDPDYAWSGAHVWGNDISPDEQWNGEYQDDKYNRLTSSAVDISGYDRVILEYRRWLNVEDGYYDKARILSNDEVIWENHASSRNSGEEHHQDIQWVQHIVEIPVHSDDGLVEISWELETDGGLSMGGWNLDDVCVKGVLTVSEDDLGSGSEDDGFDGSQDSDTLDIEGGSISGCSCSSHASQLSSVAFWGGLLGLIGLGRRRS